MKIVTVLAICVLFLSCGDTNAQMPDKKLAQTGDPLSGNPAWNEYTVQLLVAIFPEDKPLVEKLTVVALPCDNVQARVSLGKNSNDPLEIIICSGLIQILDNEDEYACALAHEYGHIKLKHKPSYYEAVSIRLPNESDVDEISDSDKPWWPKPHAPIFTRVWMPDYKVMAKQEPEADVFSFEVLRKSKRNPCAMLRVLEKLSKVDHNWHREDPDEYDLIGRKRIKAITEKGCLRSEG